MNEFTSEVVVYLLQIPGAMNSVKMESDLPYTASPSCGRKHTHCLRRCSEYNVTEHTYCHRICSERTLRLTVTENTGNTGIVTEHAVSAYLVSQSIQ